MAAIEGYSNMLDVWNYKIMNDILFLFPGERDSIKNMSGCISYILIEPTTVINLSSIFIRYPEGY